ncbi:MAG: hypothetical protein WB681_12115 [Candidatus Cybelea sp.]
MTAFWAGPPLVIAAGVVAVASFFLKWSQEPSAILAGLAAAWCVLTLPCAVFLAWRDERMAVSGANEALQIERDSKLPKLIANVRVLGRISDHKFFVYMDIRNEGHRSIARDFMPVVTLNGKEVYGRLAETAEALRFTSPDGSKRVLFEKDAMYNAAQVPIEPGEVRSGHLIVTFDNTVAAFPKELVRLRFRDYQDAVYETEPNEDIVDLPSLPNTRMLPFERNPD